MTMKDEKLYGAQGAEVEEAFDLDAAGMCAQIALEGGIRNRVVTANDTPCG